MNSEENPLLQKFDVTKDIFWDETKKIDHIEGAWWVKGDTGSWEGPSNDWNTSHRQRIVQECIDAGRTGVVVQAGGNLGIYPKLLSKYFGMVYTFEPEPINFACLSKNVVESNVIKINAALGENNQMISMGHIDYINRGATPIKRDPEGILPCFMIDQLGLKTCDLIWLDIEGFETQAINGAMSTIQRCLPHLVVVETTSQIIEKFLSDLGYKGIGSSVADKIYRIST